MLITTSPKKIDVDNSVDNSKSFAQAKFTNVENSVIHSLSTGYSQVGCGELINCFRKNRSPCWFQTIIFPNINFFKKCQFKFVHRFFYSLPFIIMFFTLSTINLVLLFSFTSFAIFLQACITVEWSLPPKSTPICG